MRLSDILKPEYIKVPLEAKEKKQAITELINLLGSTGQITDVQAVTRAVMEREAVRSTGVGQGFAIPHGKTTTVSRLVITIGKPSEPVDFESVDSKPVGLIILLVSPLDQTGPHIQALAQISRLMTDHSCREKLWAANTADQMYDTIANYENNSL